VDCYQSAIRSIPHPIVVAAVLLAAVAGLTAPVTAEARASKEAYRGAGAWIDVFDVALLADPALTVQDLSLRGIRTIYVETANYSNPPSGSIKFPVEVAALIDAAHAIGMRVVAWYLPGFKSITRDLLRSLDAIRFTTIGGGRFDSFALDIESNAVRSIKSRNRRAILLSKRIRRAAGRDYPLGAIVPDERSTSVSRPSLWPRFPYRGLRRLYDVFLPMTYSSFRGRGGTFVYGYTVANIEWLRAATRNPNLPVHLIGGIANKLRSSEDTAFVQAATDEAALGASFYKARVSDDAEWQALTLGFPPQLLLHGARGQPEYDHGGPYGG
jgi:hypothetical protein